MQVVMLGKQQEKVKEMRLRYAYSDDGGVSLRFIVS
jgi:hypothetical protein